MTYWYVSQPDKSLHVEITRHSDGTYGIGGYLKLYEVEDNGYQGPLICVIHLNGASNLPEDGTGSGSESGFSSGDSSILEVQELPPNNVHPGVGARALAALESDQEGPEDIARDLVEQAEQALAELESDQEGAQGQEAGGANGSNQA